MWNIRRKIDVIKLPRRKVVIEFIFPEQEKSGRQFWLISQPGYNVDLCTKDPAFDVDLYVKSDLKTLTAVGMGLAELSPALAQGSIVLIGDNDMVKSIEQSLVPSSFAAK